MLEIPLPFNVKLYVVLNSVTNTIIVRSVTMHVNWIHRRLGIRLNIGYTKWLSSVCKLIAYCIYPIGYLTNNVNE